MADLVLTGGSPAMNLFDPAGASWFDPAGGGRLDPTPALPVPDVA